MTMNETELAKITACRIALSRLAEIRNDLQAKAPNRWEDLMPEGWETNKDYVEQGRELLAQEQRARSSKI